MNARWLWLLLAATIVRLWIMPLPSSLWVDEMGTAFVVEHGASHPSFAVAPQVPDSLYYWLPRVSVGLFGHSEIAYRVPGLIAMAAAIWLVGLLAARLIGPEARWFAVFACLAVHGIDYYAVDARPYGLAMAIAAAGWWFLVRWLDEARWRDGLAFVVSAALLWRIHLLDWPMYLVFAAYAAARVPERVGWKRAAAVFAILAAALAPVAAHAIQLARQAAEHVIVPVPGWRDLLHLVRWNLVAICAAGAWMAGRGHKAQRPKGAALLAVSWWLAPTVCLFAFSHLTGQSVFIARYVSIALPGAALSATLAAGIFLPLRYWRTAAAALGIGALAAFGSWSTLWPAHEHSGWREAAAAVNRMASPGTPVICPSPFIEARLPDYPLPNFLFAHLAYYPIAGRILPFPFESIPPSMPGESTILVYGSRGGVSKIETWYTDRKWHSERLEFGDVWVVRLRSNSS